MSDKGAWQDVLREYPGVEVFSIPIDLTDPQKEPITYRCPKHGPVGDTHFEISLQVTDRDNLSDEERDFLNIIGPHLGKYCLICYTVFITSHIERLETVREVTDAS